jgi:hypothetical protein
MLLLREEAGGLPRPGPSIEGSDPLSKNDENVSTPSSTPSSTPFPLLVSRGQYGLSDFHA